MKFARALAILAFGSTAAGCVSYASLQPQSGAEVSYYQGLPQLTSVKQGSTVVVMPAYARVARGPMLQFLVAVTNNSSKPIDFDPDGIVAGAEHGFLHVYSYAEVVKSIERSAGLARLGAALNGASQSMQAQNAAYQTSYTNGSVQSFNSNGNTSFGNFNATTTTYNPAAAAAARAQVEASQNAQMDNINANETSAMQEASMVARRTTIPASGKYAGVIKLQAPSGNPDIVDLQIDVGGEVHTVRFNYIVEK